MENGTALAYGELSYLMPLTAKVMDDYELRPSRDNIDIRERMNTQAQAVGAWEVRNGVAEDKRLTVQKPGGQEYLSKPTVAMEQLQRAFDQSLRFPIFSRNRKLQKTDREAR